MLNTKIQWLVVILSLAFITQSFNTLQAEEGKWESIFNGKNLDGWNVKIRGEEYNDNYANTFRVRDGKLVVCYDDGYKEFKGKYGHIFYKEKLSNYKMRIEYRFVGEQPPRSPGWAYRNNGIMIHCQDPKTMDVDQSYPVSIEAQILSGNGKDERTTGNVCSPGTHFVWNDKLITAHCNKSNSKTYHMEDWVTMTVEVRGSDSIKHFVNGDLVFDYSQPQLDPKDKDAQKILAKNGGKKLISEGYVSFQSESHPIEIRKVELMRLDSK